MMIRKVQMVSHNLRQDNGIVDFMHNINIMTFPDKIIRTKKRTGQIVPLRNIGLLHENA
jgi:hypothetical protein